MVTNITKTGANDITNRVITREEKPEIYIIIENLWKSNRDTTKS